MSTINQRLRLYGKPASKTDIAKEVLRLMGLKMGATEIMHKLSFSSRQTVYNYRDFAKSENLTDSSKSEIQFVKKESKFDWQKFNEKNEITTDDLVKQWIQDIKQRKGGKGLVSGKGLVNGLINFCNTLRIDPQDLLKSKKETEQYGKNFMELFMDGKADIIGAYHPETVDVLNVRYMYAKMTRDFMSFFDFSFRKGETGWFAQKVPNHAKYADIRFSEEEFEEADKYLKKTFGLDSDEYRFFWIGVESCSRIVALTTMSLDYTKHTSKKTGKSTYIMTAIESKTAHIKGGKWTKYITRPDTQKSIDLLKSRGGFKIYESKVSSFKIQDDMRAAMLKVLIHLGKIPNVEELQEKRANHWKQTGNYWFDHLGHFLRHIGAHMWLKKKRYNYGLVAKIGGWNTIDELKASYGEMPPEVILELLEDEDTV